MCHCILLIFPLTQRDNNDQNRYKIQLHFYLRNMTFPELAYNSYTGYNWFMVSNVGPIFRDKY